MADLSQYTGQAPTQDGIRVISRFVTEDEYEQISICTANPSDPACIDPSVADEFFAHTLYYISED